MRCSVQQLIFYHFLFAALGGNSGRLSRVTVAVVIADLRLNVVAKHFSANDVSNFPLHTLGSKWWRPVVGQLQPTTSPLCHHRSNIKHVILYMFSICGLKDYFSVNYNGFLWDILRLKYPILTPKYDISVFVWQFVYHLSKCKTA